MINFKKLTIITVCKNIVSDIGRTIDSIVQQTCQDFEWIIIDGKSTDGTAELIKLRAGDRVDTFISEIDHGIYDAMNKGIKYSHGEYLLFLNGGDVLYEFDVIERVLPMLCGADVLYGSARILEESGSYKKLYKLDCKSISRSYFFEGKSIPHPSAFIKRELFYKFGFYDKSFKIIADRVFFSKLAISQCLFESIPHIISNFYIGGVSSNSLAAVVTESELKRWRRSEFPIRYGLLIVHNRYKYIWNMSVEILLKSRLGVWLRLLKKRSDVGFD